MRARGTKYNWKSTGAVWRWLGAAALMVVVAFATSACTGSQGLTGPQGEAGLPGPTG